MAFDLTPLDSQLDGSRRPSLENDAAHRHLRHDCEVAAVPNRGGQVAPRRRHASIEVVRHGNREHAVGKIGIDVGPIRKTAQLCRIREPTDKSGPELSPEASDRNGAGIAMERVGKIKVALEALEGGQDIIPAPAIGPAFRQAS